MAAWLFALLALLFATPASAQTFPPFTGLVTDAANVLPADRKAALEAKLEAFQQRTKRQLVVATLPDLQGYPIEDYGYKLGRAWGVGLADANNGAILIVAPNERKVRVEVGYGLEPVLTDALSSVVINQAIVPAFKIGDMAGGIEAGADALIAQLSLSPDEAKAKVDAAAKAFDARHKKGAKAGGTVPLGVIFWLMVVGFIILSARRKRAGPWGGRRMRGGDAGSDWPIWLWAGSEIARGLGEREHRGGGWGGGGGSDGSWGGGGFTGGGGGSFGGGGASGEW